MKTSALKIASYAKASFMEDESHNLLVKLSDLWQSLASARVNHLYEERLYNVKCRAYYRYVRRCNITSDILRTQQIASAVEREAFPDLRCSFCDRVLDDNGKCPSQYCESNDFLNSGDTFAAPRANAPELAQAGQGSNLFKLPYRLAHIPLLFALDRYAQHSLYRLVSNGQYSQLTLVRRRPFLSSRIVRHV